MSARRLPIALPVASSGGARSACPDGPHGPNLQTTYVRPNGGAHASRVYVTRRQLAELARLMSDRDLAVVNALARVRVATGRQLERLHFTDVTDRQARSVLASLVERRLVARLPRAIGGVRAGSAGSVYALDVAGTRLSYPDRRRHHRPWQGSTAFLEHGLAVTETYVRAVEADRVGQLGVVGFVTEPSSWRDFHGPGGVRVVVKPDAALTVRVGRFEDRWYLEVDRGTESRTTLARKCDVYRQYWQAGVEQARTGVFPRVLWLVPDTARRDALLAITSRQPGEAWTLFAVALFDDLIGTLVRGAAP